MTGDADLAADLAYRAGRLLLDVRDAARAADGAVGEAGDAAANDFLVTALRTARPDDGLLSEEMRCNGDRLRRARTWIIDPVDGTREYAEGRIDWAVHVGLAVEGRAVVGAVALPDEDVVLRSDRRDVTPASLPGMRIAVSRTRPPPEAAIVARALGATLVPMGSAGAKAMAVVRGTVDAYLHLGGQHEWDSAAPVAVANGYGLHCSRTDGAPVFYNCPDVYVPDLLICRPALAAAIIDATAAARAG